MAQAASELYQQDQYNSAFKASCEEKPELDKGKRGTTAGETVCQAVIERLLMTLHRADSRSVVGRNRKITSDQSGRRTDWGSIFEDGTG
jgi:hypothetical protein